ncbi:unnamed protein product [Cunninghamella echinulata]
MTFKIPSASLNDDNDDDIDINHKEEDDESDNGMDTNHKEKEDDEEEEDEIHGDEDDEDYKMITYNDFDEENEKEDQLLNEEEEKEKGKQDIETNQFIRIIPHIDDPSKPVIFDVIQWKKKQSSDSKIVRLGRCPPTSINNGHPIDVLLLKSKVVSRYHCDIGYENGKVYVRDVGSSSGTYLNHNRLCGAHKESDKIYLKDGDILQLGVQYQDGLKSFHRCVKLKVEMHHQDLTKTAFYQQVMKKYQWHHQPYQHPSSMTLSPTNTTIVPSNSLTMMNQKKNPTKEKHVEEEENEEEDYCSICLDNISNINTINTHPEFLFVSPCAHLFHHSCIQPLISSIYPGFQCPVCRHYANLETDPFYTTANFQQQQLLFDQQHKETNQLNIYTNNNKKERSKSQRQRHCKTIIFPFHSSPSSSSSSNNNNNNNQNSNNDNSFNSNELLISSFLHSSFDQPQLTNNSNIYPYQFNLYNANRQQQQEEQEEQEQQNNQGSMGHRRFHSVIDKIRHVYEKRKSLIL